MIIYELASKLPSSFYIALTTSILTCALIVKTNNWHNKITEDVNNVAHKIHNQSTPRVGGVGIFIAVVFAYLFADKERASLLGPVILAGLFAFLFGLAEDLTKKVNVSTRLMATVLSGFIGWAVTGISISHVDINLINSLLKNQGFSVLITAFAIGGIANAINLIDGLNGLASFMVVVALITISMISHSVGDIPLALATLTIGAAIFGFFIFNWPWGKIFLGDGGSYFSGFALAWSCVLLVERNLSITPFAALLICIYPFIETIYSIYRRIKKDNSPVGADLGHLHSMVFKLFKLKYNNSKIENSLAGIIVGTLSIPPAVTAFYFKSNSNLSAIAIILYILAYIIMHKFIENYIKKNFVDITT